MKRDEIGLDFAIKSNYKYVEFYPDTGRIIGWGLAKHTLVDNKSKVETKIATVKQYSKMTEGEET